MINVYINTDSVSDTGAVIYSILTSECKEPQALFEIHKISFQGNKKPYKIVLSCHLQLILTSYAIYTSLFAYKTEFLWCFDAGLEHNGYRDKFRLAEVVM